MDNIFDYAEQHVNMHLKTLKEESGSSDISFDVKHQVELAMKEVDIKLPLILQQLAKDIVTVRPNMGETLGGWWKNIKNFAGSLWKGTPYKPTNIPPPEQPSPEQSTQSWKPEDYKNVHYALPPQYSNEVYNAQLYNVVKECFDLICEENNPRNIQELINNLFRSLRSLIYLELTDAIKKMYRNAYDAGIKDISHKYKDLERANKELQGINKDQEYELKHKDEDLQSKLKDLQRINKQQEYKLKNNRDKYIEFKDRIRKKIGATSSASVSGKKGRLKRWKEPPEGFASPEEDSVGAPEAEVKPEEPVNVKPEDPVNKPEVEPKVKRKAKSKVKPNAIADALAGFTPEELAKFTPEEMDVIKALG